MRALALRPLLALALLTLLGVAPRARGQDRDDDLEHDRAQPDFTVITLPTNHRLPKHRLSLFLTHRFARPLGEGDFGDLAGDFFGFDGGAQIGLGLRLGLFRGTQVAFYRTSDRTIELFAQRELLGQQSHPLGLSLHAAVEGLDNFSEEHSPSISLVLSRKLGTRGALYAVPRFVWNTNQGALAFDPEEHTLVLGFGLRLRFADGAYIVAEAHPRLAGYKGDRGSGDRRPLLSLGLEKSVGGHSFQISVSNDLGTTPAQVARGQQGPDDWFIGFNLTRKFY